MKLLVLRCDWRQCKSARLTALFTSKPRRKRKS